MVPIRSAERRRNHVYPECVLEVTEIRELSYWSAHHRERGLEAHATGCHMTRAPSANKCGHGLTRENVCSQ